MPLLGSIGGASARAYGRYASLGYFLSQSLRFRSSASTYLSKTPASAGNRKTWTWSAWVKRSKQTGIETLFKAYTDSTNSFSIYFGNTSLSFGNDTGTLGTSTASTFRDPSAWYHIVFALDTTQATASDRCKLWVNGTLQPLNTLNAPSLNQDLEVNNSSAHYLGGYTGYYFDGYMGDVYLVDGQALTPSDFGKTDASTGQWIPKKYAGTYGNNGWYLDMTTSGSTVLDQSGNGNDWTATNMDLSSSTATTYDKMSDVPTLTSEDKANFATLNPLSETSNLSTSEANLAVANSTTESQHRLIRGTIGMSSGKYYWEVHVNNSANVDMAGISPVSYNGTDNTVVNASGGFGYGYSTSNGNWYAGTGWANDGTTPSAFPSSGIIGVAFDADNGKIYFSRNNTWINSANPSAGTGANGTYTGNETEFLPAISIYNNTGTWRVNFGQRPFAYTPPTGFKKLNTYNL